MALTIWQQRQWPGVERELARVVRQLRRLDPVRVVLFGSYARGDFHEGSDVDLFIVQDTDERVFDRVERVLEAVHTKLSIEPLVYTPAEVEQLRACGSGLLEEVEREGRILYERSAG